MTPGRRAYDGRRSAPSQSHGSVHGASRIQGAPVGRDVNDRSSRECTACRLLRRCTHQRGASRTSPCVVRTPLRLLRAALALFRLYVLTPFVAVDRPLIVSCPEQGSPWCGASTTRDALDVGVAGGVSADVGGDFGWRMRVPGRGRDVVGGAEVSRVLSSRGGGPTHVDRRVLSASVTFGVVALRYQRPSSHVTRGSSAENAARRGAASEARALLCSLVRRRLPCAR